MSCSKNFIRKKYDLQVTNIDHAVNLAREFFHEGKVEESLDIYEMLAAIKEINSIEVLAEVYDLFQSIKEKNRFNLYQKRIYDFNIQPGDKVLDIGSGHLPFPFATHLADISTSDHNYGRAGSPFKFMDGKPFYEFNVEDIPFEDKEFDFVYCSHVLEHTEFPEKACSELIRVAGRGYIETPTKAKDLWLNTAKVSNHKWSVDFINNALTFTEYTEDDIEGFENNILMEMHTSPQTKREKALSALIYLKPQMVNTMLLWEDNFYYEVKRKNQFQLKISSNNQPVLKKNEAGKLKFVQVHTFYEDYLDSFYSRNSNLGSSSFKEQTDALINDGFSGIHIIAPYMNDLGYDSQLIIANNKQAQLKWLKENNISFSNDGNLSNRILAEQINRIEPDVLYLSDPITFDSKFVKQLNKKPQLVIGWRAADIPASTDWSLFDIMLSGLTGILKTANVLGAKESIYFTPGFPQHLLSELNDSEKIYDVVFCGSWTTGQHKKRNEFLKAVADYASQTKSFRPAFFINGKDIDPAVAQFNHGALFGKEMHRVLAQSKIVIDSRGDIRFRGNDDIDIAGNETINMRLFEAAGCGAFLLTENFENLPQLFKIGKEIETFKDAKELIEKIEYYLTHENKRKAIALAGQQRCLKDYSMQSRTKAFDDLIKKSLSIPIKISSDSIKEETTRLYDEASVQINNKNFREAFELLNKAKGNKINIENLDLLRAICFISFNDFHSAKQALLEELSFFPGNSSAGELLNKINLPAQAISDDAEFKEVLKKIEPYTMLSYERLFSLFQLAKEVCEKDIPGSFVECGVARGGSSAMLAYIIKKYSRRERLLYSFDTFAGMPEPTAEDKHSNLNASDTGWGTGTCAAPVESLMQAASLLNAADIIKPVPGLFQDTLPSFKNEVKEVAFLHLDGDWYESTKTILENLYDNISAGGILQVDDYGYWNGCKKAVHEFEGSSGLNFNLNKIDDTGVWFVKENISKDAQPLSMLNLGCGEKYHKNWVNIDFVSRSNEVIQYDLNKPLPFENSSFDVVYHSHLLEHFTKSYAPQFIKECFRVLKAEGIIRIVIPDLEQIIKIYLELLHKSLEGDIEAQKKYEWIMLELYDQTVRNYPGGEMKQYWSLEKIPAKDFVIQRMGSEAKIYIAALQANKSQGQNGKTLDPLTIGNFRMSGEIHQWMYDRYSLGNLLKLTGFREIKVCAADESAIPNFNSYYLDIENDFSVRKPDSLFMEGRK